jgi:ABC-type transporter Mla subunit MlaD
MKIPPAAKVGLLTIIAILILIFSLMWLKGRSLATGDRITAQFQDVDGMRPGSTVQLMGIKVGQVEEVLPVVEEKDTFVKVNFIITRDNTDIPQGSVISVQQSGIIGEKFLEITPPEIRSVQIPLEGDKVDIKEEIPVKLIYKGKMHDVGEVKGSEIVSKVVDEYKTTRKGIELKEIVKNYYKIRYIITRAGLEIPDNASFEISGGGQYILITPPDNYIVNIPPTDKVFTTEEPLRIKSFMELQVQSAEALKATNDKINVLLQPEQIENLKDTLRNTKLLTAKATDIIDQANSMIIDSKADLKRLVDSSAELSDNLITVSNNVNEIIGDPQLREDILDTVHSIKQSTNELNQIISDPNIKDTIQITKETSQNVSELVNYLKDAASDEELKERLSVTICNLNQSLDKLSELLDRTEKITENQEEHIKEIVENSTVITQNMKKFSKKLNKRFLLFRLLF